MKSNYRDVRASQPAPAAPPALPWSEGATNFTVGIERGMIVLKFEKPIGMIGFTPGQAIDLADLILARVGMVTNLKRPPKKGWNLFGAFARKPKIKIEAPTIIGRDEAPGAVNFEKR